MALINPQLRNQYAQLHRDVEYGAGCSRFALHIQACITDLKPTQILDYGCGQSTIASNLDLGSALYHKYDPAIPEVSEVPVTTAEFMINTDVMEHIPREDVNDVLRHMRSISGNVFFNIATRNASQILPNGENAHCTVMTARQWLAAIVEVFPEAELVADYPGHSCLILTWKSPVLSVLAGIERLRIVERQCDEFRQSSIRRIRKRARRVLDWITSRPVRPPILFPDTRRIGEL